MFLIMLAFVCIKVCRKANRNILSINKTLKAPKSKKTKTRKISIPKDLTKLENQANLENTNPQLAEVPSQMANVDLTQTAIQLKTSNPDAQKQVPVVENEFQILRRQLLSNIRNNNDNYEHVFHNDLKKNYIYKY